MDGLGNQNFVGIYPKETWVYRPFYLPLKLGWFWRQYCYFLPENFQQIVKRNAAKILANHNRILAHMAHAHCKWDFWGLSCIKIGWRIPRLTLDERHCRLVCKPVTKFAILLTKVTRLYVRLASGVPHKLLHPKYGKRSN